MHSERLDTYMYLTFLHLKTIHELVKTELYMAV